MTIARTRIKICGITNFQDAADAISVGADALGFVFYSKSPRYIDPQQAQAIIGRLPPFVTTVGLFVNESTDHIRSILETVCLDRLQFHGHESNQQSAGYGIPWFKAVKAEDQLSLASAEQDFPDASALLLDTPSEQHGGTGKVFDWTLIPSKRVKPLIVAGGLNAENVERCILSVAPYAVDVSSGVEASAGKKDKQKMREFIARARTADEKKSR